MKIYFPQWQGSGTGRQIEQGARAVLEYLNDDTFVSLPLSTIRAGVQGKRENGINNYSAITAQLQGLKAEIKKAHPDTLRTVGGDCGLEIVPVSFLNKKYPNLGVIWFDAHADINRPCDSASCNFHGMPLRTLLGEGEKQMDSLLYSTISASQIHYVGLRDIDDSEQFRIDRGAIFAPKSLNISTLVKTLHKKKITHIYLHFDFDCLDPSEYGHTYYKVPNGIKIEEAEECIKALQVEFTMVGSSVLESIATNVADLKPIENILSLLMK